MDKKVIQKDFDSCQHLPPEQALRYQLMYQLTRLTADRGALTNDDRLDALAMACQYWVDAMAQDVEQRMGVRREELMALSWIDCVSRLLWVTLLLRDTKVRRPILRW